MQCRIGVCGELETEQSEQSEQSDSLNLDLDEEKVCVCLCMCAKPYVNEMLNCLKDDTIKE